MLATANLTTKFFNFAMDYAVDVSRCLVPTPQGKSDKTKRLLSPHEKVTGNKPDYNRFHPFGCLVAVHVPKKLRTSVFASLSKHDIARGSRVWKAEPGIFLGYKSQRIALVYLFRTATVTEALQFRPCTSLFPGLSLTSRDLHPLLGDFTLTKIIQGKEVESESDSDSDSSPENPEPPFLIRPRENNVEFEGTIAYGINNDTNQPVNDQDVNGDSDEKDHDGQTHGPIEEGTDGKNILIRPIEYILTDDH